MHCRVVFPSVEHFLSLSDLLAYIKRLTREPDDKAAARFFLFGEDVLGVIQRSNAATLNKPSLGPKDFARVSIIDHKQALSFISHLQNLLGPRDFVVFSVFEHMDLVIFNSVYLVGRSQWFFDFKRYLAAGDKLVLDASQQGLHRLNSLLNPRGSHCVRAGSFCIRNINLAVCADVYLLPKARFAKGTLVFLPASGLEDNSIFQALDGLKGSGHVLINDPALGLAWDLPFGRGVYHEPVPLVQRGREPMSVVFELK